ncbi:putative ribonuclease H-like domain-containing protein [Tanacetum coccineum]|uniref:Ribonuclease H-like domain-containing protein n=1 Tax=Tanacetum coccineum TaxID=301880 RepID=A0ABQ4WPE1_9ASTR
MDSESAHMVATSKILILKPGEFELWRIRIEQYIQMIDYALWEVIENGNTATKTPLSHMKLKKRGFGGNAANKDKHNTTLEPVNGHVDYEGKKVLEEPKKGKETNNVKRPLVDNFLGYDWSDHAEEGLTNYVLMAYSSSSSNFKVSNDSTCSKSCLETVEVLKSQYEQLLKRFEKSKYNGFSLYRQVYRNFMPPKPDLSFTGLEEFTNEPVVIKPVVENSETKASEAKPKAIKKNNGALIIEDWCHILGRKKMCLKLRLKRKQLSLVDCNYQRVVKPVWNNAKRVNHQNFAKKTHPCPKKNMVPRAVLMKSGLVSINIARQNISKTAVSVNTARQVNTAHSKTTVNAARPKSHFSKTAHSIVKRPIHKNTTFKNSNFNQRVNTVKDKNVNAARPKAVVNAARPKAVVNAVKGNNVNVVKASACWVWKPKTKVLDHVSKHNSASITLKKFDYGNPQIDLQDKGVIDSGCSRIKTGKGTIKTGNLDFENVYFVRELKFNLFSVSQMYDKKNSVLFNDTECIVLSPNFKLIDESQVLLRVLRKNNMYSVDLKNIVPKRGLTCLFAKATSDESKLWHRRLGHLNFKTMNKLVKGNLVRGLPSKLFENDQTCVACQKGKQHKASSRTPQQNGVVERRNRTLIEAARIMLADSKLPTTFWAEAVNTTCYVQNRVLVVKSHNKTPYELFHGKFDGKADEGFFVGYSLNSKAFRVFNSRTRIVEENLHIRFSESTSNVVGSGPDWLCDIDALIRTMNYKPIIVGTQSNSFSCTKASDNAGQARKETEPVKNYILLSLWPVDLPFSQDLKSSQDDGSKPSSDDEKKVNEDPRKDSKNIDQEKDDNVNSTNNVNVASTNKVNAVGGKISIELPDDPNMLALEDISIFDLSRDYVDVGAEADMNNWDTTIQVSPIPTTRIHNDHPLNQVIGDLQSATQTRNMSKNLEEHGFEEPKKVIHALKNPSWIEAMQEDLLQFKLQEVWTLVDLPNGKRAIEGINYDEVFAPVARIEAIRLFLAYDSFKDFVVYQMDVKSAFLYGKIEEEVYVCQPPGFEDPDFPDRVYMVEKALYGLHQAPKAWYETLTTYLLDNEFQRGKLTKPYSSNGTKMSSMGELAFFLGLQVQQKKDGIFISQDKYVGEILKKFGFTEVKTASTPMETQKPLLKDEDGEEVNVHMYRSMIGSLIYLTSSRSDIMFAVCACARYQVNPKISHLYAVKKIFRLLSRQKLSMGEVQLQALVDGKKIIITESIVRRDLQLEDAEGVDCLPNATIFKQLTLMGYEKISQKLTFYKAFFSPKWKFLIHTILQCLSSKTTASNEFKSIMAFAIICLATNQKFNFSKYIFESMVKNLDNVSGKF